MSKLVKISTTNELSPGTGKAVEVEGKSIALFKVAGTFHAIENECTHQGGPLGEGSVRIVDVGVLIRIARRSSTDKEALVIAERLDEVVILVGRGKGQRTPLPVQEMVDAEAVCVADSVMGSNKQNSISEIPSVFWREEEIQVIQS